MTATVTGVVVVVMQWRLTGWVNRTPTGTVEMLVNRQQVVAVVFHVTCLRVVDESHYLQHQ